VEGKPLEGEFLTNAKIVNTVVNQLGSFASEVTRVAREVGTEGKLGGRAVAWAVRAAAPATPVLLLTGWGAGLAANGATPPTWTAS
jgi:hypothetical protein